MRKETLTIAVAGCGARGSAYASIMAKSPGRFRIVAGADPQSDRRERMRAISGHAEFQSFDSYHDLLGAGRALADVLVVATQDRDHLVPALKGLELGYDLLLEKPAATNPGDVLRIAEAVRSRGRRIILGFVLRYTAFYQKVKEIVDSGVLGEVTGIQAREGVEPWHQGHSFVRGHWSKAENSTPMLVAKSSHDMDIIAWLLGRSCRTISSFGSLSFFRKEKMPAGATERCTDGCPHLGECLWDAHRYLEEKRNWLEMVFTRAETASDEEVLDWLSRSPWGRCVFQCDNDVVDHQVVNMEFEGGATACFTMTAFDEGRSIEIDGTEGTLKGRLSSSGSTPSTLSLRKHRGGEAEGYSFESASGGHQGGDEGLVRAAYDLFSSDEECDIEGFLEGHIMGFAGEEARISGMCMDLREYRNRMGHPHA